MQALDTATQLTRFERRGAGTDAERRAAVWLANQARGGRRRATLQTFWCRPNWALAQAWHALAAIIGSLLEVHHGFLGGAIVLAALLCVLADAVTGRLPGPRLAYRTWLRAPFPRLKRVAGPLSLGWVAWLAIAMVWLLAVAVERHRGIAGTPVSVLQLIPTAGLVLALALLLELAAAPFGPAASDNGSGAGVAIALVRALDAAPPRRLDVELLLQGAGDAGMVGL